MVSHHGPPFHPPTADIWRPSVSTRMGWSVYVHMHGKKVKVLVAQSCPTLCDPMDYSPPGSSVHRILQARILEWVAISFSRGSSWPRDRTQVFCITGRLLTIWTIWSWLWPYVQGSCTYAYTHAYTHTIQTYIVFYIYVILFISYTLCYFIQKHIKGALWTWVLAQLFQGTRTGVLRKGSS